MARDEVYHKKRFAMGIIDKTTYKLSCAACSTSETSSVLDKGSNWSGSWWQGGASFLLFNTQWSEGGKQEPDLKFATCKKCAAPAKVETT